MLGKQRVVDGGEVVIGLGTGDLSMGCIIIANKHNVSLYKNLQKSTKIYKIIQKSKTYTKIKNVI